MKNALQSLGDQKQSVWLDFLSRGLIASGELQRLIDNDGICGLTSNPSIFEKAIAGSSEYRSVLEDPTLKELDATALYEHIAVRDIQDAADILKSVYFATNRRDGYVSLEVSPVLAHDTEGTVKEGRRLWKAVARENLMIKVPATPEGIPAVQQLIGEGINVNVTLLFSQKIYEHVAAAYFGGLESYVRQGGELCKVASVASFFISRIDTSVDDWITERMPSFHNPAEQAIARSLFGKVAIASAKVTYHKYLELLHRERWQKLSVQGACPQRLLWASTGTKNPKYRDVVYIEKLIGSDTVTTISPATMDAFRDHGYVRPAAGENLEEAISIMDMVQTLGMPFEDLMEKLLNDGVRQFFEAFQRVLDATGRKGRRSDMKADSFSEGKFLKNIYDGQHSH
jgi:transaldolase/glucose-6-phosphate isomerase